MKPINIVIAINESFAAYSLVTLNSLYKNHENEKIDTYVLYVDLSRKNINLINDFARKYNQNVFCIDAGKYLAKVNQLSENISFRLGKETYLRLLAPELLPDSVDP